MKPGQQNRVVSCWLSRKHYEHVSALARSAGITKAAIARIAVERFLASQARGEPLIPQRGQCRSEWEGGE